jgi:chromosome segregation ATPase
MARKPRKSGVQDIIKSLVDSEIPEIQAVAKQLSEWTKQLEEHSWKLQHYASEIESLAAAEAAEGRDEVSLAELVKDLERTLAELRGGTGKVAALPEGKKPKVEVERSEPEVTALEELKETDREDGVVQWFETYTTPEGFVVRKVRR